MVLVGGETSLEIQIRVLNVELVVITHLDLVQHKSVHFISSFVNIKK